MTIEIEVAPSRDDEETSMTALQLRHIGCAETRMRIYRNPATNDYRITCTCGLEIALISAENQSALLKVAIGQRPALMQSQMTTSPSVETIRLVGARRV